MPWYNTIICSQLNGSSFEYYFATARRDIYNIMCLIEYHERDNPTLKYYTSSGGIRPLPPDLKKNAL